MLIEFSVGNFRSFKEIVTLSMEAAPIRSKGKLDAENTFEVDNMRLLKSAAVYGANASGKSNLVKAIGFMRQFIRHSPPQSADEIAVVPFLLNTETTTEPSFFEIVFQLNNKQYRYGFQTDNKRVHKEWLYHKNKRETMLFEREKDIYVLSKQFKEGHGLTERTRPNRLFLSVVDEWNGSLAGQIMQWFANLNLINASQNEPYKFFTFEQLLENGSLAQQIKELLRQMDLGIVDWHASRDRWTEQLLPPELPVELRKLLLDETSQKATIQTIHLVYDGENKLVNQATFDLEQQESDGTQKAFAIAGPFLYALSTGSVLVVDELDARLHPLMTRQLLGLFNSAVTNPNHAQLIFATHDANLLNNQLLRRDQIWFAEKNRFGATNLFSLVEYKGVRNDASYEADYLDGRYGAIPYLHTIAPFVAEVADGQNK